jgi:hypothetical protein
MGRSPASGFFDEAFKKKPRPNGCGLVKAKTLAAADDRQWHTILEPEDCCPLGSDSLLPTLPRIWYAFGLPVKSLVPMAGLKENAQRPVLALAALSPPGQDLP